MTLQYISKELGVGSIALHPRLPINQGGQMSGQKQRTIVSRSQSTSLKSRLSKEISILATKSFQCKCPPTSIQKKETNFRKHQHEKTRPKIPPQTSKFPKVHPGVIKGEKQKPHTQIMKKI